MNVLLVTGAEVLVTMDHERRVLTGHGLACVDGRISEIAVDGELRARFPGAVELATQGGWITPGMINAHQHLTGDRLARCTIPDDLEPGRAITDWAIPLHAHHEPADDEVSALTSCTESLRNGVTTVVEAGTVSHPERVGAAMLASGIRGTVGTWGWDVGTGPFTGSVEQVIERQTAVLDAFPRGGRVTGWVTLVGHDLMSEDLLVAASALAAERQTGLTFHQSPTASDAQRWLERSGRRPIVRFGELGALGPHVLIAHGVHLDGAELDVLVATKAAVAYCPWAYLRLGQGVTKAGRHAELVERGGRVALGCDSENAGDQLDVLRVAALAAGLAKDVRGDPTRFGAREVFELATTAGAEAIGMADQVGSLAVGKRADLVVHDTSGPTFRPPGGDPYLQLVWGTDGRSVRHVVVDGEVVVRDGRCVRVDELALAEEARRRGARVRAAAGLPLC